MVPKYAILVLVFIGAALLGTVLLGEEAAGKIITVDDDGNADYSIIQEAIDAADPGDTVRVHAGIYFENLLVNKSINLEGNGSEVTIIDGGRKWDVVFISADHVNLSGIAATKSNTGNIYSGIAIKANFTTISDVNCSDNNDGISIMESSNIVIDVVSMSNMRRRGVEIIDSTNITISNLSGFWIDTYGVYHQRSDNCTFTDNNITSNGTSILIGSSRNITLWNNVCSSDDNLGIRLTGCDGFSANNNTCYDNYYAGLDIHTTGNGTIRNNTISNSEYGIRLYRSNSVSIIGNTCFDNDDDGIYLTWTEDCTVDRNNCSGNLRRGISLYSSCYRIIVTDNICRDNGQYGLYSSGSENNTFENNTCSRNVYYGIYFYNSDNTTILNNSCDFNERNGIRIYKTERCSISFNRCEGNLEYGIYVEATYCDIFNNTVNRNEYGFWVYRAENNTIHNNSVTSNQRNGFHVYYASNNLIANNTITNNSLHAIYVIYSTYNTFSGNRMERGGIDMRGYSEERLNTHDFSQGNTVNGKPVYHFRDASNLTVPTDGGQVILTNCTSIRIEDSNCSNGSTGILIGFSSDITMVNITSHGNSDRGIHMVYAFNCSIRDSYFSDNQFGLFLENCQDNKLISTIFKGNKVTGIQMEESQRNHFSSCRISDSVEGIYIHDSSNNTFTNNSLLDNDGGILLDGTSYEGYSVNNSAHHNHLVGSVQYGIRVGDNDGNPINATNNWWGHDSGPYHPTANPNGQGDNITEYVDFSPWEGNYPFIDFISPNPSTDYEQILFSGHGIGEVQRYVWHSSIDGEFSNDTDPEVSFLGLSLGQHIISFRVQNQSGNWSVAVNSILDVTTRPEGLIYSITPNPALDTDAIQFKGNGTDGDGHVIRYVWQSSVEGEFFNGSQEEFSNGNLSVGGHIIFLRVQDDLGIWSNETSYDIYINGKPVAYIDSITPNPALRTEIVQFQGHGTDDRSVVRYVWTSSIDGELANGTDSSFTTDALVNGTHTILLRVQDDNGTWSEADSFNLIINGRPVAAIISISPDPVHQGENVYLNASGTDDGDIIRYTWRSSIDGQFYIGSKDAVTKWTLSPGEHELYLKIMDEHGFWSEEVSGHLHVNALPTATIKFILPNPGKTGDYITFRGVASDDGAIQLYEWDFDGDGTYDWTSSETGNTTIVYDTPGTYYPVLRVTDDLGASNFATLKIIIERRPPEADFAVFHSFDPFIPINDSNDGFANGFIDIFYGDRILLKGRVNDYIGGEELTYRWEIKCVQSEYLTHVEEETIEGMVGEDFFIPGKVAGLPIRPKSNSGPKTYEITIFANDPGAEYSRTDIIRVHPYAQVIYFKDVTISSVDTQVSVDVTWRGTADQAAAIQDEISPLTPVFIFINESVSPDPDLEERGGIGPVYNITSVGCRLQNGSSGIIRARMTLPVLVDDLGTMGDVSTIESHLRVEWYDNSRSSFLVLEDESITSDDSIRYVSGTLDHLSLFTVIIDSIYNSSNPEHLFVLPDLSIDWITFSRSPALEGQFVEIRVHIVNTGLTHARNVEVTFYDEDVLIGSETVEVVSAVKLEPTQVNITFQVSLIDPFRVFESHFLRVVVNELRTIDEGPDRYRNNEEEEYFVFVASSHESTPEPRITFPRNGTTVRGKVLITGDKADITNVSMVNTPFGNNDFAWHIERVNPQPISVHSAKYRLLDHNGEDVDGGNGTVSDVYGLNIDDLSTPISFQDNDRDGKLSAGDVFLVKNALNGGLARAGYSLQLECGWVDEVEISIDGGEWTQVSGTDPWSYEWDSSQIGEGECNITIRSVAYGAVSGETSVIVMVVKDDRGSESSSGSLFLIFMGTFILIFAIFIGVIIVKRRRFGVNEEGTISPPVQGMMGHPPLSQSPTIPSQSYPPSPTTMVPYPPLSFQQQPSPPASQVPFPPPLSTSEVPFPPIPPPPQGSQSPPIPQPQNATPPTPPEDIPSSPMSHPQYATPPTPLPQKDIPSSTTSPSQETTPLTPLPPQDISSLLTPQDTTPTTLIPSQDVSSSPNPQDTSPSSLTPSDDIPSSSTPLAPDSFTTVTFQEIQPPPSSSSSSPPIPPPLIPTLSDHVPNTTAPPEGPEITGEPNESWTCPNCGFICEASHQYCVNCGNGEKHPPEKRSSDKELMEPKMIETGK